jgi:hypothetical protein
VASRSSLIVNDMIVSTLGTLLSGFALKSVMLFACLLVFQCRLSFSFFSLSSL